MPASASPVLPTRYPGDGGLALAGEAGAGDAAEAVAPAGAGTCPATTRGGKDKIGFIRR